MNSICTKYAGEAKMETWNGDKSFILELLCLGYGDWNCRIVPILENANLFEHITVLLLPARFFEA